MEEFYAEKRPDQICILEMKLKFTFGGLIGGVQRGRKTAVRRPVQQSRRGGVKV